MSLPIKTLFNISNKNTYSNPNTFINYLNTYHSNMNVSSE